MIVVDWLFGFQIDKKDLFKLICCELDVLSWMFQGKMVWEVSVIFGMSEKMVNFYFGNVMCKLDVMFKYQVVFKCVVVGLFQFVVLCCGVDNLEDLLGFQGCENRDSLGMVNFCLVFQEFFYESY